MRVSLFPMDSRLGSFCHSHYQWKEVCSIRLSPFPVIGCHFCENESITTERKSLLFLNGVSPFPIKESHFQGRESITNDRKSFP